MKLKKILSVLLAASLVTATALSNSSLVFAGGDTLAPRPGEQGYLGENQPVYHGHRAMDILNWSPETDEYSDFMRAEVPLQQRNEAFAATQANPLLSQEVASLSLTEDYGNEFFNPYNYNDDFAQYVFNFWQYLDYRASWHGVVTNPTPDSLFDPEAGWWERAYEFGILNIPNPAYTNAAHKNGVQSLGCIFFPRQEHTDDLIFRDETGRFPAADKLVEIAKWYGFDGYFINAEETLPADFMPEYEEFCRQMTEQGIYIQVYASNLYGQNNQSSWGSINYYNKDASGFSNWIKGTDDDTIAANSLYMNPGPSTAMVDGSVNIMNSLGLDARKTVFQTLEAGQTGFSGVRGSLNNLMDENLVPRTGIANLGAGTVWAHLDEQVFGHTGNNSYNENRRADPEYQKYVFARERTWWSGSQNQPYYANDDSYVVEGVTFLNKNTTKYTDEERQQLLQAILDADTNPYDTANDPTRGEYDGHSSVHGDFQSWPGMAAFISERSVIKGSNFVTNFNTGHGMQYFKNGEVSNDHEWSNINDQDILPTWQWWYETSDGSEATLNFDFDYGAKYNPAFELNQIGGYDGSSSLVAKGPMSAEHFLRLYKTKMDINENSKLDITFFKTTADDASQMKVGLIFEDAPETVEYITVNNSGKQSTEWTTETLDLSAYAGRTLAAFGLAFDPNGEELADYQMNIGEISITDNDNAPAAPTGLTIDRAFNTDETYLSWDLADYDDVQKYNVYAVFEDGTEMYMGGIYDDNYYVKSLYDNEGVVSFKVTAEGANGVESEAAVIVRDLNKVASDLAVEEGDGVLNVSWTNPDMDYASIRADVTLPYNYAGNTETYTAEFAKDAVSGTVEVPVTDGSDYYLRLSYLDAEGNAVSYTDISGQLLDDHCDPYEGEISQSIVPGKGWKLQNPLVYDWWHLTAWDSEGNVLKDNVTRGVDDLTGLRLTTNEEGYGYIEVQLEDFSGNVSEKTRVYYGEPPKTNKSLLEKTYEYALNQSTEGVVDSAVKKFEEAKAAAKTVLDNAYASQEEINTAWSNLVEAIHGLGLKQGDKTNLKMLIDMADEMVANADKYVDTNWQQLVDALEAAKNVYNDGDAMEEDVQPAADALLNAILAQRFKADKSNLEDLINKANDIDLSKYTDESVAVFKAALKTANTVLADESLSEDDQDVVDNAVSELNAAIENLSAKDDTTDPDDGDNKDDTSKPDDGKGDTSSKDDATSGESKDESKTETPATGDNMMPYAAALALLAASGCAVVLSRKKRSV